MKLVLADDEALARLTLRSMIADMEAAWDIAGEAANGEELILLVEEHKPDIAIVDIGMPKLNGLEAIRRCQALSPLTNWIIVSGYSEFNYAKQALQIGVSDYLLKPVQPSDLEAALHQIYKDSKEYTALLNQQFENGMFALCHGLTRVEDEEPGSVYNSGTFRAWTFAWDTTVPVEEVLGMQAGFYSDLRQRFERHLGYGIHLALVVLPNGEAAAIGACDTAKCGDGERRMQLLEDDIRETLQARACRMTAVTIFRSGICRGFAALNSRLRQLQDFSVLRSLSGVGGIYGYEELERMAKVEGVMDTARLLCQVASHSYNRIDLAYTKAVEELEQQLKPAGGKLPEQHFASMRRFLQYALGLALPPASGAERIAGALRSHGDALLGEKGRKEAISADLAEQVLRYVENHYTEDIGIGQIAAMLRVSPNYLSALFHKKTGTTFVKHLTRIRMLKAKELLIGTNMQIRQVAEEVGYYSTRHFTKLFTETFGSSPSYYRKLQVT